MAKRKYEKLKCDPNSTKAECRWRISNPDNFKRIWTVYKYKKLSAPGLRFLVGINKKNRFDVQAIRFRYDKGWTEEKAQEWWRKYHDRFAKTWKDEQWKAWFKKQAAKRKKKKAKPKKSKKVVGDEMARELSRMQRELIKEEVAKSPVVKKAKPKKNAGVAGVRGSRSGVMPLVLIGLGLVGLCIYGARNVRR